MPILRSLKRNRDTIGLLLGHVAAMAIVVSGLWYMLASNHP
ncbi:hypothetical protein [Erythrobacter aureus]|nr:hypothetical protein [Erythrobacter aureus]